MDIVGHILYGMNAIICLYLLFTIGRYWQIHAKQKYAYFAVGFLLLLIGYVLQIFEMWVAPTILLLGFYAILSAYHRPSWFASVIVVITVALFGYLETDTILVYSVLAIIVTVLASTIGEEQRKKDICYNTACIINSFMVVGVGKAIVVFSLFWEPLMLFGQGIVTVGFILLLIVILRVQRAKA